MAGRRPPPPRMKVCHAARYLRQAGMDDVLPDRVFINSGCAMLSSPYPGKTNRLAGLENPVARTRDLSLRAGSFAGLDEPGPRSHRAGAKAKKAEVRATVCHFAPLIPIAAMSCLIARPRATCA